jgi:hypothetical protein
MIDDDDDDDDDFRAIGRMNDWQGKLGNLEQM